MIASPRDVYKRQHELKTPMAGIKLICDSLVAAENPDPAMVKEFLGDMSDEVDRLTRIVERLLVLTKLDAGGNSLKLEEVDIKTVSYTHLDVYKRQTQSCRCNVCASVCSGKTCLRL